MMQEVELNGVKVKIEITPEMARKVLDESEEVGIGEDYWFRQTNGTDSGSTYSDKATHIIFQDYCKQQDNFLPCRKYNSIYQAKEYFDKRDVRRAAEYRIKKAIEKMNGGQEKDSEMSYTTFGKLDYISDRKNPSTPMCLRFNWRVGDYMLEHHTEDYKIYLGIE